MIKVIGKENCSACSMVKTILNNKYIPYEYILMENLSSEEKSGYINLAREQRMMAMPLIIKNEKLVSLQEVIA